MIARLAILLLAGAVFVWGEAPPADIAGLDEPVAYAPNPEVARKGGSISGTLPVISNTIAMGSPVMLTGTTAWTTAAANMVGLPANCVVSPTNGGGIAVCGSTALPR